MTSTRAFSLSGLGVAERPAAVPGSNIDSRSVAAIFVACGLLYLFIYSVEAPIRFVLYLAGKDWAILARDGLMAGPLVLLAVAQALRLRLHPAFVVSAVLVMFHGLVLFGTVGSLPGVAYGVKVLMNLLFGFFAAALLITPGPKSLKLLMAIWLLIMVGICLDKFVMTFPWTGIKTVIGDLNVDVSKDWQIQDPLARRVAGFTRSSIAVAAILPCLTIVLLSRVKHWLFRAVLCSLAVAGVFLTTQKGSLIAFLPVAGILCLPVSGRIPRLRLCLVVFMIVAVSLPLLTNDLHLDHGSGVFSAESLHLRIAYTWPDAWHWIDRHQMLWFGVGLGGIGGPQRLYALNNFNPADNIFILLYAYFGIFSLIYGAALAFLALRPITGSPERVETALAILAFTIGYGAVLSIIEDQSASLFMGAAIGVLWRETTSATTLAFRSAATSPA